MEKKRSARKSMPVDAFIIPEEAPTPVNIFHKLIHDFLRQELATDELQKFYAQLPGFSAIPGYDPEKLSDLFWEVQAANSPQLTETIASAFEHMLHRHNKSIDSFHRFIKTSICHKPDLFTWSIYPAFNMQLSRIGMKEFLLRNAYLIPPCIHPGVRSELIAFQADDSGSSATIAIFTNIKNPASPIDIDFVLGPVCRLFPLLFGVAPFTNYTLICDETSIGSKMKGFADISSKHGSIFIDNNKIGRTDDFGSFITACGLPFNANSFAGKKVIIPESDVYCQKRHRIAIHKDCAYGAPFSIFKLFHSPEKPPVIGPGMPDIKKHQEHSPDIHQKNAPPQLRDDLIVRNHVRFNSRLQSISINGRHLTSGIPAKILRLIVKDFTESDIVEFEWSDLAANRELISHPNNTGLSTRLNRIAQCLCNAASGITLEKFGRGKYRLSSTKPLSYSEV